MRELKDMNAKYKQHQREMKDTNKPTAVTSNNDSIIPRLLIF
jgi:hypothetical protein